METEIIFINKKFLDLAGQIARQHSLCLRDCCGAVIVLRDNVIATGYNAPPKDDITNRKCMIDFPTTNRRKPKSSCQCCDHAEVRAVIDMITKHPGMDYTDTVLYFTRVDEHGSLLPSGEPYCVECARFAFHNGISYWVLNHEGGSKLYDAKTYYDISYDFHLTQKSLA